MKRKQTKQEKARDKQIDRAFNATCSGIQINVMDIGKVFKEGHRLLDAGADDAALNAGILAFVQTIAKEV